MAVLAAILIIILLAISSFTLLCSSILLEEECIGGSIQTYNKWLNENGSIRADIDEDKRLDLSANEDALEELMQFLQTILDPDSINLRYLSLANNGLTRLNIFFINDAKIEILTRNLNYFSLMGNDFSNQRGEIMYGAEVNDRMPISAKFSDRKSNISGGKINWTSDLEDLKLSQLIELDLRYCGIEVIQDASFATMKNLQHLYLGGNQIHHISSAGFKGLVNLVHLDVTSNYYKVGTDALMMDTGSFTYLINLLSLDISHTRIATPSINVFRELGPSLIRLSLCDTRIPSINGILTKTSLRYLDISGNVGIQDLSYAFDGIQNTLEILYARRISLTYFRNLRGLTKLTTLALTKNNIAVLDKDTLLSMPNLVLLDVSDNRISSWFEDLLMQTENLKILLLQNNNINLLSPAMLTDFGRIQYLAFGMNEFVCNCYMKGFIERSLRNIENVDIELTYDIMNDILKPSLVRNFNETHDFIYDGALDYYLEQIQNINNNAFLMENDISENNYVIRYSNNSLLDLNLLNFTYKLIDYTPTSYICTDSRTNEVRTFVDNELCSGRTGENYQEKINNEMVFVYVTGGVLVFIFVCFACIVWKWWYVRYFFVMLKNTATMTLLGKDDEADDPEKLYHYDVFVSYCHDDRNWVLDDLLPQIEQDYSISVCLHERDFQVGLSILENIISGIDRSRTILLIVSQEFLLSQWCQFEMHLAQHRLLETRREELILILLEDIPRKNRPSTLHYLMMTKTYLIWPKSDNKAEVVIFWKRLRKALMQGKFRDSIERISTA